MINKQYVQMRSALVRAAFPPKSIFLALSCLFINNAIADEATQIELSSISVTGNPLGVGSDELVVPVSILNGRELSLRRESTLGDTLNGIPGVSATHFGPNASRPVIRGLDAERVRIMQNGVGVLDASSLSFDHAVTIDPLVIEQIDVVRGPAALLYGGSAVGGVVNAIDHRIPKEKLEGITGRAEGRLGGADSQSNLAGVVDVGNGQFAIHADMYSRKTSDLDIPGFAVSNRKNQADGTLQENKGKLINSSATADGGALGASLTFDNGYLGASYSGFNSNYGTVAEPTVRADMKSDRWDLATEFRELGSIVSRVKARMAYTDYQHQEVEDGEIATTFKNKGIEGSIEAGHAAFNTGLGNLEGVLGFQFQNTNFEALGDEAFVPPVNTQSKALYVYEEMPLNLFGQQKFKLSFGGRAEHTTLDASPWAKSPTAQNSSFNAYSYALGGLYTFNPNWSFATNLSHNERAPSYFELYADGEHLATGQYEIGNPNFGKERSNGLDAQIRWKVGRNSFNVGAYYTRFSSFLGLLDTGVDDVDSGLPIAQFSAFAATFKGLEAEGKFNIVDNLDLTLRGDYVRASNQDNSEALPRITPLRLGAGLRYQKNSVGARLDVLHAFSQTRTAVNELPTDSYTNVSALVSYKLPTKLNVELFAKANNLLNQEIREHASFLKDISPAGERSLILGLRSDF
ncbi:MAG: TonB-dependent receptor [Methylotenera sp.]|uniref:TonB-dependent receptor n=1 Tax=Methylotenera sp. TaxID=2051956 RepID=UPI002721210F|nr:TonB-dependent receptor [Methylotenera sp.]MDO9393635.1 TonB-dependent receptor [Methylotenera sp.]